MEYIIGMDGGGTKTHTVIANQQGKILFECTGSASNFLVRGTSQVSETLLSLIEECKNKLNIGYEDIKVVLIGTTGAGRRPDAERLESAFNEYTSNKNISLKRFRVESDARIALEGAFSGRPGSILIAGTGSIMFGKDAKGFIHRVGGFGRFLGDEGSGYAIGRKGLVAVSKDFDGRGRHSIITELLSEKFNIDSQEKLITEIYKNNFDMASAAPLVIAAAEKGDGPALTIIDEETDELVLHISAMLKKLMQKDMDLAFIGGIITNENIYSKELKRKIMQRLTGVNVKQPDHSPAMGAVLMAADLIKSGEMKK